MHNITKQTNNQIEQFGNFHIVQIFIPLCYTKRLKYATALKLRAMQALILGTPPLTLNRKFPSGSNEDSMAKKQRIDKKFKSMYYKKPIKQQSTIGRIRLLFHKSHGKRAINITQAYEYKGIGKTVMLALYG